MTAYVLRRLAQVGVLVPDRSGLVRVETAVDFAEDGTPREGPGAGALERRLEPGP